MSIISMTQHEHFRCRSVLLEPDINETFVADCNRKSIEIEGWQGQWFMRHEQINVICTIVS